MESSNQSLLCDTPISDLSKQEYQHSIGLRKKLRRSATALLIVFVTSCGGTSSSYSGGGGSGGGGSGGGGASQFEESPRAVDLTCEDGQFWGRCIITWSGGSQEEVCNITPFGCQQIGQRRGDVVETVRYLNNFFEDSCFNLYEGGWIEDCYNPSQWLMPSGSGSNSSAESPSRGEAQDSGTAGTVGIETTTTTTTIALPPELSVGTPRLIGFSDVLEHRLSDAEILVTANLGFALPISLVNSKVESVCAVSSDPAVTIYLIDGRESHNNLFNKSNCTALSLLSQKLQAVENAANFAIYIVLGKYPDGYTGFARECIATGQEICRTFDINLQVSSSGTNPVSQEMNVTVDFYKQTTVRVLFTPL